jgi:hypothetical protein
MPHATSDAHDQPLFRLKSAMYPYTSEPHKGIEASLAGAADVIHLFVESREADDFFFWTAASAEKLKQLFPQLKKVVIEDDYLSQKQIDELPALLAPVIVEWTYGLYLDGRHGR